jgi:FtsZ-interacting cell division protein ZipA
MKSSESLKGLRSVRLTSLSDAANSPIQNPKDPKDDAAGLSVNDIEIRLGERTSSFELDAKNEPLQAADQKDAIEEEIASEKSGSPKNRNVEEPRSPTHVAPLMKATHPEAYEKNEEAARKDIDKSRKADIITNFVLEYLMQELTDGSFLFVA